MLSASQLANSVEPNETLSEQTDLQNAASSHLDQLLSIFGANSHRRMYCRRPLREAAICRASRYYLRQCLSLGRERAGGASLTDPDIGQVGLAGGFQQRINALLAFPRYRH